MQTNEPVLLDAALRPSPPMSPAVLGHVLALVVGINLVFAVGFALRGAWFVMPFMGLDIALLAWAFRASTQAARRRERVMVTPSALRLERRPPQGAPSQVALNPYWVRVEMADPPEHGSQLTLWSHGKGFRVGAFLAPAERQAFAKRLKAALRRARETFPSE